LPTNSAHVDCRDYLSIAESAGRIDRRPAAVRGRRLQLRREDQPVEVENEGGGDVKGRHAVVTLEDVWTSPTSEMDRDRRAVADDRARDRVADRTHLRIGTFKNPPIHRQVNFENATEASEVVLLADLLLRMLDRTAQRLGR
jgi:hypothetical protein